MCKKKNFKHKTLPSKDFIILIETLLDVHEPKISYLAMSKKETLRC